MNNKNIKKCLACGLPIVIIAGILYESTPFCHECFLHRQEHLPEGGFAYEQLYGTTSISLSGVPASGVAYTTLEDINTIK